MRLSEIYNKSEVYGALTCHQPLARKTRNKTIWGRPRSRSLTFSNKRVRFKLLESRGFRVLLVNARHVKNVSGCKSDVLDCPWLQPLMTYGLLSGAFRPTDAVCALRSLWRQRGMLLRSQGRHVQHQQKALTQMSIQLANVISDVVGETGQKILRAIVAGERDGQVLAALKITPALKRSPKACKATGAPSTCFPSSRRWRLSISSARRSPTAAERLKRSWKVCKFMKVAPQRQKAGGVPATRGSSIAHPASYSGCGGGSHPWR